MSNFLETAILVGIMSNFLETAILVGIFIIVPIIGLCLIAALIGFLLKIIYIVFNS